jgi:DNA-binding response OmpR family regulator
VIAMHLEDLLVGLGHKVARLVTRLEPAMKFARTEAIDFAVLDVNIAGEKSFPVADILRERGIPFIFASGYGSQGLKDSYATDLVAQKPYEPKELERLIALALA